MPTHPVRPRDRRWLVIPVVAGLLAGLALSLFLGLLPGVAIGIGSAHRAAGMPAAKRLPQDVTPGEARLLYMAEQVLITNCMRKAGFSYWPVPYPAQSQPGPSPFPLDNVESAQADGFGSVTSSVSDPDWDYFHETLPSARRPAYITALDGAEGGPGAQVKLPQGFVLGHSENGCTASAQRALYGSYPAWFRAVNTVDYLEPIWQAQVLADPRYQHAVTRWAACMHAAGYPYASPAQVEAVFTQPPMASRRSAVIRAAVAEARCANATGLAQTTKQLAALYAERLQAKYAEEVTAFRELRAAAIPRARNVIKAGLQALPAATPAMKVK